jgi:hypothetical protein
MHSTSAHLSHLLLHSACTQRGIPCPSAEQFKDLINALSATESAQLRQSALEAVRGKDDLRLLLASAIAARLYTDPRLHTLLGHRPRAIAVYRSQLNAPEFDLVACVHHASAQQDASALAQLLQRFPSPPCPAVDRLHTALPGPAPTVARAAPATGLVAPPVRQPRATASAVQERQALSEQPKFHVWRSQAALTVEWATAATPPVLFCQSASKLAGGGFDWAHRISLAISASEAFQMLQVCLGLRDGASIRFHGPERNKSCELTQNQDAARTDFVLLMRTRQGSAHHLIGLSAFDVLALTQLLSLSVASNLPGGCTPQQAIALVRAQSRAAG